MARKIPGRVGIRDVAKHAGVSPMTVSRTLNNSARVKESTRAKIEKAIKELGYKPDAIARALSLGHTQHIGILIHSYSQYGPMRMLEGMYAAASKAGYTAGISIIDSQTKEEFEQSLASLASTRVDGVAVIAPRLLGQEVLPDLSLPDATVFVGGKYDRTKRTPGIEHVYVDQEHGARLATNHLIKRGHKVIVHLSGPSDWIDAIARQEAWKSTLEEAGLPVPAVVKGDWSAESGYRAVDKLLEIDGMTAIFVSNDQMALGVIHGLRERGYRIPEDISIVGFDDRPEAAHYSPPLTTVSQKFEQLGEAGMNRLLAKLDVDVSCKVDRIEPHLVQRSSVRSI